MTTTPYLDLATYKGLSLLRSAEIDRVDAEEPAFFAATFTAESAFIDSRLAKRYAAPFITPYPIAVQRWLARIVDGVAVFKAGFKPEDPTALKIDEREKDARAELKEAADSKDGLFDLPLRADTNDSGIAAPRPLGYSEHSPYVAFDVQADLARCEDANGVGTGD